jgi:antitoxin component of RelBE/YafQ-DinJ toxin-antitoxin module
MTPSSVIDLELDDDILKSASVVLEAYSLSVEDGIALFLSRVAADRALPFSIEGAEGGDG